MRQDAENAGEEAREAFKQQVFASAFSSFDPKASLQDYYKLFEEKTAVEDFDVEDYVPETEADVREMMNVARRAGAFEG